MEERQLRLQLWKEVNNGEHCACQTTLTSFTCKSPRIRFKHRPKIICQLTHKRSRQRRYTETQNLETALM